MLTMDASNALPPLASQIDTTGAWDWDMLELTDDGQPIWWQPARGESLAMREVPIIPDLPRPTFDDGVTPVPDGWVLTVVADRAQWLPPSVVEQGRANAQRT